MVSYRTLRRHTHLDSHRHRLESEALRPVDEIWRYAQSHRVPEFSQLEPQSECGLHIAPCTDSRQQCAHDLLLAGQDSYKSRTVVALHNHGVHALTPGFGGSALPLVPWHFILLRPLHNACSLRQSRPMS